METALKIILIGLVSWIVGVVILLVGVLLLPRDFGVQAHPPPLWLRIPGNLFGWPLILAGILFLPTPVNGIVMILIGIIIADFPRKHRVLLWIINRRGVLPTINRVRKTFHRPLIQSP